MPSITQLSIRKLIVLLLTASPYRHLVYYTMGMANLKIYNVILHSLFIRPGNSLLISVP